MTNRNFKTTNLNDWWTVDEIKIYQKVKYTTEGKGGRDGGRRFWYD